MRIAIITTQFPVLNETFIFNKVKALAERGHQLRVFTVKQDKALFNQLFHDSINVSVTRFSISEALLYSATHSLHLLKIVSGKNKKRQLYQHYRLHAIQQFKPDVIHFEFSGVALEYLPVINNFKGKKVVSCRGTAEKVKLLADAERKKDFAKLVQQADAVHCVSGDMRNTVKEYVDVDKTFVNYPSIDAQFFNCPTPYQMNTVPIIMSVGRFIFPKNYMMGLLAMRRLADSGIAFKWMIVATGPQYEEVVFHIQQLSLQNYVELVGSKRSSEIKVLLEKADIFLLTSVYEGVANAALEAMSMQLPVVSTACGGMPEVITCGKNGLLAGVYDYEKLAEHISYLIQHPEEAAMMGIAARERILEQFTLEQQTDTFERIYQQITTA